MLPRVCDSPLRGTEEACWGWSLLGVPGLVETLEDGKA